MYFFVYLLSLVFTFKCNQYIVGPCYLDKWNIMIIINNNDNNFDFRNLKVKRKKNTI